MGVVVVDMGAGSTSLAVFADGALMHVDAVTLGGNHVTMDIARGLDCAARATPSGSRRFMAPPSPRPRTSARRSPSITSARAATIRPMRRNRISCASFGRASRRRWSSCAIGWPRRGYPAPCRPPRRADRRREPAHRRCPKRRGAFSADRCASAGRSASTACPKSASSPAFAAAVGLLVYPQVAGREYFEPRRDRDARRPEPTATCRVSVRWLRESF